MVSYTLYYEYAPLNSIVIQNSCKKDCFGRKAYTVDIRAVCSSLTANICFGSPF